MRWFLTGLAALGLVVGVRADAKDTKVAEGQPAPAARRSLRRASHVTS